jgi:predicted 5'-methylthioadenosine/S-adenosylhomocysteine nucleosidase
MSGTIKRVGDRKVLYVMAAEPEYGPHLKARFEPLITGVGPVEAAGAVAAGLSVPGRDRPDCIVCLGSAGSRMLEQTGIYQVSSVSYRDMDASPLGFEKGRTPFLDLPAVLPLPVIAEGVPTASLSTGANIVSGAAYDLIDADMVDTADRRFRQPGHATDRPPPARAERLLRDPPVPERHRRLPRRVRAQGRDLFRRTGQRDRRGLPAPSRAGVFELGVPILGICYGQQVMMQMLGGEVLRGEGTAEFGRAYVEPSEERIDLLTAGSSTGANRSGCPMATT